MVLAFALLGCKKDHENPAKLTFSTELKSIAPSAQLFHVDVANGASIQGYKGTRLMFPPNAFFTQDGNPVSGTVIIELVEIYDRGGMIMHQKPTISNNQLLVSGGEVYIKATQDEAELTYNGAYIAFPNTNAVVDEMQLFVFTDGTWATLDPDSSLTPVPGAPPEYIGKLPGNFNWINCDYFYNNPNPPVPIHVNLSGVSPGDSTLLYIVFTDFLSVAGAYPVNGSTNDYVWSNCPTGVNIKLVGISWNNGSFKAAVSNTINTAGMPASNPLTLQSMGKAEVKALLEAL